MKISEIKPNPNNPRILKDEKFKKLVKSIEEFPKMMELRPIVIDNSNMVLGGNMRLKALQHLKFKEIPDTWVKQAETLTDDEKQRFIIADNVGFGEWDWDIIANEWDAEKIAEWGLDLHIYGGVDELLNEFDKSNNPNDYSNKYYSIIIGDFKATINDEDICSKISKSIENIKNSIDDSKEGIEKANTIARNLATYFIENEAAYTQI